MATEGMALILASMGGKLESVEMELRRYPDRVNAQHPVIGATALHMACQKGHAQIVSALLRNGADRTIRNKSGLTPLRLAELSNHTGVIMAFKEFDLALPSINAVTSVNGNEAQKRLDYEVPAISGAVKEDSEISRIGTLDVNDDYETPAVDFTSTQIKSGKKEDQKQDSTLEMTPSDNVAVVSDHMSVLGGGPGPEVGFNDDYDAPVIALANSTTQLVCDVERDGFTTNTEMTHAHSLSGDDDYDAPMVVLDASTARQPTYENENAFSVLHGGLMHENSSRPGADTSAFYEHSTVEREVACPNDDYDAPIVALATHTDVPYAHYHPQPSIASDTTNDSLRDPAISSAGGIRERVKDENAHGMSSVLSAAQVVHNMRGTIKDSTNDDCEASAVMIADADVADESRDPHGTVTAATTSVGADDLNDVAESSENQVQAPRPQPRSVTKPVPALRRSATTSGTRRSGAVSMPPPRDTEGLSTDRTIFQVKSDEERNLPRQTFEPRPEVLRRSATIGFRVRPDATSGCEVGSSSTPAEAPSSSLQTPVTRLQSELSAVTPSPQPRERPPPTFEQQPVTLKPLHALQNNSRRERNLSCDTNDPKGAAVALPRGKSDRNEGQHSEVAIHRSSSATAPITSKDPVQSSNFQPHSPLPPPPALTSPDSTQAVEMTRKQQDPARPTQQQKLQQQDQCERKHPQQQETQYRHEQHQLKSTPSKSEVISKEVIVQTTAQRGANGGFGIVLGGGVDIAGQQDIFIRGFMPDSPSALKGELHVGDIIVAVDGESIVGATHEQGKRCLVHAGAVVSILIRRMTYEDEFSLSHEQKHSHAQFHQHPIEEEQDAFQMLIDACQTGHIQDVSKILSKEPGWLHDANFEGISPLSAACSTGQTAVIGLLFQLGANPNARTASGSTALLVACQHRQFDAITAMIAHQSMDLSVAADMSRSIREDGRAPNLSQFLSNCLQSRLFDAICRMDTIAVKSIVEGDAALVHAQSSMVDSGTALHAACHYGCDAIVSLLLVMGANAELPDARGATPLCVACAHGQVGAVALLLRHGVNPRHTRKDGLTPIDIAGACDPIRNLLQQAGVKHLAQQTRLDGGKSFSQLESDLRAGKIEATAPSISAPPSFTPATSKKPEPPAAEDVQGMSREDLTTYFLAAEVNFNPIESVSYLRKLMHTHLRELNASSQKQILLNKSTNKIPPDVRFGRERAFTENSGPSIGILSASSVSITPRMRPVRSQTFTGPAIDHKADPVGTFFLRCDELINTGVLPSFSTAVKSTLVDFTGCDTNDPVKHSLDFANKAILQTEPGRPGSFNLSRDQIAAIHLSVSCFEFNLFI